MAVFGIALYRYLKRGDPALLKARVGMRFHRDQPQRIARVGIEQVGRGGPDG